MPYQDGIFGCPVDVGLQMISGKWKPQIFYELLQQTLRFGELQRRITGISRYALTDFGRSLEPILQQLIKVGEHSISLQE